MLSVNNLLMLSFCHSVYSHVNVIKNRGLFAYNYVNVILLHTSVVKPSKRYAHQSWVNVGPQFVTLTHNKPTIRVCLLFIRNEAKIIFPVLLITEAAPKGVRVCSIE